jgi:hypothetical protein
MEDHPDDWVARPFYDEAAALMKPAVPSPSEGKRRQ